MRTQVGIVGAGPAGLFLSHLLAERGIDSVVIDNRSREYAEARIRAGVLEAGSVDALTDAGLGDRLHQEGLEHHGIYLQFDGERHHLDFQELVGRSVWVYGQTEVVKDLLAARDAAGRPVEWEVSDTAVQGIDSDRPSITYTDAAGNVQKVECDVIAGCDGFHGISRPSIPTDVQQVWDRTYPYSWLGILADVAPSTDELIYAWHPDGFAMHSMRSPTVSRLYLQVDSDADIADWSDGRIWDALATRMALTGWSLTEGAVRDKSITPMRSYVSTPMRHGNLFLAGDAAHIVPPTGAKGLNLALADVALLTDALGDLLAGDGTLAEAYSETAIQRVWRKTHFSWWMTSMLHTAAPGTGDDFDRQLQLSQLRYVTSSRAAAASLAENYAG